MFSFYPSLRFCLTSCLTTSPVPKHELRIPAARDGSDPPKGSGRDLAARWVTPAHFCSFPTAAFRFRCFKAVENTQVKSTLGDTSGTDGCTHRIDTFFTGTLWKPRFSLSLFSPVRGLNSSRNDAMMRWSDPTESVTHRAAKGGVAPAQSRYRPRTGSSLFPNASLCLAIRSLAPWGEPNGERPGEVWWLSTVHPLSPTSLRNSARLSQTRMFVCISKAIQDPPQRKERGGDRRE